MNRIARAALCLLLASAMTPVFACALAQREADAPGNGPSPAQAALQAPVSVQQEAQPTAESDRALPDLTDAPAPDAETLRVLFVNVGKADAILLQYGGRNALIDTGTEESAPRLLGALHYMGVDTLDLLFLTHTHKDHIGGVPALCKQKTVTQAYAARYSENKKNGENRITNAAADAGVPLTRLSAGERVPFADGADFVVLGPLAYNDDDDNDNSLVLRLTVNGRTLLLTGDMQFAEEETLLDAGVDVSADVLKVGNHGNPDATGDGFGRAVSPAVAVISTDTREDEDSANPRVYAALSSATVHVTQDTVLGVLLEIKKDGAMTLYNAAPAAVEASVALSNPDRDTQSVTIQNNGPDRLDVSNWMLQSERGGELMTFPTGSAIAAGATVTVAPEGGMGEFVFSGEAAPWHKKKADAAILYDRFGILRAHS